MLSELKNISGSILKLAKRMIFLCLNIQGLIEYERLKKSYKGRRKELYKRIREDIRAKKIKINEAIG